MGRRFGSGAISGETVVSTPEVVRTALRASVRAFDRTPQVLVGVNLTGVPSTQRVHAARSRSTRLGIE